NVLHCSAVLTLHTQLLPRSLASQTGGAIAVLFLYSWLCISRPGGHYAAEIRSHNMLCLGLLSGFTPFFLPLDLADRRGAHQGCGRVRQGGHVFARKGCTPPHSGPGRDSGANGAPGASGLWATRPAR